MGATPDSTTHYQAVASGTLDISQSSVIQFADPLYANTDADVPTTLLWLDQFAENIDQLHVVLLKDGDQVAALVLTVDGTVPPALLGKRLAGPCVRLGFVGVDSGTIGAFLLTEGAELDEKNQVVTDTFMGDGIYPVIAWGNTGDIFAVALLTDPRFYDPNWER